MRGRDADVLAWQAIVLAGQNVRQGRPQLADRWLAIAVRIVRARSAEAASL